MDQHISTRRGSPGAPHKRRTCSPPDSSDRADETAEEEENLEVTRCNPKRKAADAGIDAATLGSGNGEPLEEALLPMSREEIRQWSGWCELESEPASDWHPHCSQPNARAH